MRNSVVRLIIGLVAVLAFSSLGNGPIEWGWDEGEPI